MSNLELRFHYEGLRELAKQIMEGKLWSSRGLQVPLALFQQRKKKLQGWLALRTLYLAVFILFSGRLNTAGAKGWVTSGQVHVWQESSKQLKYCC